MVEFRKIYNHKYFLLIFLWAILTSINLNKAFHIDDTFHLEAAEYLIENPTKPMSGLINWENDPTPIYSHNQPPLFFFLIAIVIKTFGANEYILHLMLSIFTFFALFFFQKTAQLLSVQRPKTLLFLFAFCPALIVNQNLMTDIPVLALVLGSLFFLIKGSTTSKLNYYIIASILLGVGLLIKYSILPLIVVLILVILIKGDNRKLFVVIIPVGILILWSFWNFIEYGSIHIIDRPAGTIHINSLWGFIACLGSISTFIPFYLYGAFPHRYVRLIIYISFLLLTTSFLIIYFGNFQEQQISVFTNALFLTFGFLVIIILSLTLFNLVKKGFLIFLKSEQFILFLYLSSLGLFIILFAPFSATRHILLIIPLILLLGHELINKTTLDIKWLTIVTALLLGLLLGISDWNYADYYRKMALIKLPKDKTTWTIGHWGWKWYAKKNGMKEYGTSISKVSEGDYFVYPGDIPKQELSKAFDLIIIDKKWQEADFLTFFSGNNFASMYNSSVDKPPWSLSKSPIDTIYFCKVAIRKNDTTYNNVNKK